MGLEHLVIPVRDLRRTAEDFQHRLGFAVSPGGIHASGTTESAVLFGDNTYLELLGIHDTKSVSPMVQELRRLLAVREGPETVGVRISSAETAASRLRRAGVEVNGPTPLQFADPETGQLSPPFFWNVEVTGDQPYLKDVLFFCEKIEGAWEAHAARDPEAARILQGTVKVHPNTADGLRAAWLAVDDLDRAASAYTMAGLPPLLKKELPLLDARVAEIPLGGASLMLAQSLSPDSAIGRLLSQVRRPCVMLGASVVVASLEDARTQLRELSPPPKHSTAGWFGRNVVVPPEAAHGLWMELLERSPSN